MKHKFLSFVSLAISVGATVPVAPAFAAPPPPVEFEDWSTVFTTNPLGCSTSGCSVSTNETGIMPLGTVDRWATIDVGHAGTNANGYSTPAGARIKPAAACGNAMNEGCLNFSVGNDSTGSLSLNYKFSTPLILRNSSILVNNFIGSSAYYLDAFYYDAISSSFKFADEYKVNPGDNKSFIFDGFGADPISEILLIYNPLAASGMSYSQTAGANIGYVIPGFDPTSRPAGGSIETELCCVTANVPEPANWVMLIAGFGLTGATIRRRRSMIAA